jgi:diguanylate cyclase (GGDEF)-like protein/PAS domain S-box-containing protein
MRTLSALTAVVAVGGVTNAGLAASTNNLPVVALSGLLVASMAWLTWLEWRRRFNHRKAVAAAMGHVAEYALPVSAEAKKHMPRTLRNLMTGYDDAFVRMSQRVRELGVQVQRHEFVALHTEDLVTQVDAQGLVKYVSPSVTKTLGYSPEQFVGRRILDLLHPDEVADWVQELKHAARNRQSVLKEGRWRRADGTYATLECSMRHAYGLNGRVVETISMARNVEARNALQARLLSAARTDHLTGLPNRAALVDSLEKFRAQSARAPFALFLFDLDRFKQVNDSLGHAAGDDYLVETANRVRSVLRPTDSLARMGGDEFVALFDGIASEDAARAIASRIIDAVCQPYWCRGALLHPKTSIGIVLCNSPDIASDELISCADRAMYEAKRHGGNAAAVYDASHEDSLRQEFLMEQELTLALRQERLVVQFQPIVDAKSKKPVLAEALVRMRAQDGSLIGPGQFIPVAEKTGLIFNVGQWVLEQACRQAKRLEDAGTPTSISVNVSPKQLMHVNYVQSVEAALALTGAKASSIVLEVTESAVMEDVPKAQATLTRLRELGFRLALDDFGTGYSSISMLKNLQFDILKIDRAFVTDAEMDAIGPSTLAAIIDIGKSLHLTIIAEGIETDDQSRGLERLGCDLLQGFRYFRPIDAHEHAKALGESHGPLVAFGSANAQAAEVTWF